MNVLEKIKQEIVYNYRLKRFVSGLLQQQFVVRNLIYTYFYVEMVKRKMLRFEEVPLRVMVENTNICDSDCIFCPHQKMKRKSGFMQIELFKKIVDECKKLKINHLVIHGFGEPLLDKYFFEKVKMAKKEGIPLVTSNTNGMYLDKEKTEKIFDTGLDEIIISLDAAIEKTYKKIRPGLDFNTVEKNIIELIRQKSKNKAIKPKVILSFVESEENTNEIDKYLKKWNKFVDDISISYRHNWSGALKNINDKTLEKDPCRLLWTDMVVSWNGNVPLCCSDYENKVILGNIRGQAIREIWKSKKLKEIRGFHQKREFNKINLCNNCNLNFHYKLPWWGV